MSKTPSQVQPSVHAKFLEKKARRKRQKLEHSQGDVFTDEGHTTVSASMFINRFLTYMFLVLDI